MTSRIWFDERVNLGVKLGLENCRKILSRLSNPHLSFPSIHVAGTNGKGSLCAQISSICSANGIKTGLFTSPHLVMVEERIRIDGKPIDSEKFDDALRKVREASEQAPICFPTYFETTFLAAMVAFRDSGVQRAVIETGMGGRMDATILVDADLAILTTISMDHSEYLGHTLSEIAFEKAAIHRPGIPLIAIKPENSDIQDIISDKAGKDLKWVVLDNDLRKWDAYSRITSLVAENFGWNEDTARCVWPGRSPDFGSSWFDGVNLKFSAAHNSESIKNDIGETSEIDVILLAMTEKKEIQEVLQSLADALREREINPRIIFTEVKTGRKSSISSDFLRVTLQSKYPELTLTKSIEDSYSAFEHGIDLAISGNGGLLVMGSIYLIGEIISKIILNRDLDTSEVMTIH